MSEGGWTRRKISRIEKLMESAVSTALCVGGTHKRERKREKGPTGSLGRIIKIHKITDAVAISDALLTLAIQPRPRDACKFSSGGRSLATFFVECHCVYCGPMATPYPSASRAHTPSPFSAVQRNPLESPSRW